MERSQSLNHAKSCGTFFSALAISYRRLSSGWLVFCLQAFSDRLTEFDAKLVEAIDIQ